MSSQCKVLLRTTVDIQEVGEIIPDSKAFLFLHFPGVTLSTQITSTLSKHQVRAIMSSNLKPLTLHAHGTGMRVRHQSTASKTEKDTHNLRLSSLLTRHFRPKPLQSSHPPLRPQNPLRSQTLAIWRRSQRRQRHRLHKNQPEWPRPRARRPKHRRHFLGELGLYKLPPPRLRQREQVRGQRL